MTRGEASPYLQARVDTEFYQSSLKRLRNGVVLRYGGVTRVPGTLVQGETKTHASRSRLIPFEFNRTQVYMLEFGDEYIRFWTRDGRVEVASVPVEVVTPYDAADLDLIRFRQIGDVLYLVCEGYQPRTLTRNSETSWTLALYTPLDGPYLNINETSTRLTPSSRGALTSRAGSATSAIGTPANAFDGDLNTNWGSGSQNTGTLTYTLSSGTAVCDAYYIRASSSNDPINSPSAWEFQGYDGSNWITLDTRQNEIGWGRGEVRFYEFSNQTAYSAYRLVVQGTAASGSNNLYLAELGIAEAGASMTPFNLTASSTTGINDGAGFQASDVGRAIRFLGSDGRWRWMQIAAVTSTTVVTVRKYGHALPSLSPTTTWRLGAWSDTEGWPEAIGLFEDRLAFAGTTGDPLGVWTSVNADYDNYRVSAPIVTDDAVALRLTGGRLNDISWLADGKFLLAGTAGSLRAIGRASDNDPFGPENARQTAETLVPAAKTEPVSVENVTLFLDFFGRRLYEAAFTYEVDGYLAREISTISEHFFYAGCAALDYLSAPHKAVVVRRDDGMVIMFTYDREQKVAGAGLVDFGGGVESVARIPGTDGDDLWMIVRREIDGNTVRYVEVMADFWRSDTSTGLPVYGACSYIYQGAATDTITGADLLEGETVGIWADGRDIGDAVVTGGAFTLPHGVEAEEIVFGLRMPMTVRTLRLAQIGNQDGSGLGRKVNIVTAKIDLFDTAGISIGTPGVDTDLLHYEAEVEEDPDAPKPLLEGMYDMAVDGGWSKNGELVITTDKMYPVTIRGISLEVEGEP